MLTRRRKIILYIAAILLLFGIGGYFYISSDLFLNGFVKPRLIRALDEQIDDKYTMQIGHFQGNILTGVRIDDFSIAEKEGNGQSVMSTDSIVLRYNIWGLLQRKLLVSSLDIHTPIVKIYRGADGRFNITEVFQRTTSESDTSTDNTSITFAVSKVSLINGAMHYTDEQRNLDFKLPDIKIKLDGSYEEWNHTGQFSVGEGSLTINQSTFNLDSIDDIKFSLSTERDTLSRFKLKSGESEIDVEKVDFDHVRGEWNTSVKLTFNAADIQKLLDERTKIDGSGVIELDLQGTRSNIVGRIKGYSEGLSYSNNHHATSDVSVGRHLTNMTPIAVSAVNIDASLDLNEEQQLKINELRTVIADGSMSISGGVSFANTSETNLIPRLRYYANNIISYTGQCKFDKVDLHSFLTMFTTLPSNSPRIENGIIQGSIQFSGDSEGNYHFDSLTRLLDVSLSVEGHLTNTADDFISLDDSYVSGKLSADSVNGSSVNVSGVFDNIQVEVEGSIENFDIRLSNVDFGKLFRIVNAIPIEGVGSASLNVNNGSNNIHSVITGNAVIPETYFSHNVDDPIPIGHLSSDFRYTDNTVHFEKGRLTHSTNNEDSKIQFDGKIRIAENMPVNFNINLDHFVLNTDYVRILFAEDYPIEGILKGDLVLSGELIDHLDGIGRFRYENGNAWGVNLEPAKLHLEIDDYALTIPDFILSARDQRFILNLHVANNGDFDLSIKNPQEESIQLAELALASDITDFPLDGKMVFDLKSSKVSTDDFKFTIDFDFSDLTFEDHPLGEAKFLGILVEEDNHFKFTGKAFAETGIIEGTIASQVPNAYYFTIKHEQTPVAFFLPIINPSLEDIGGTFDGTVEVEGTLLELTADKVEGVGDRIYPYNVDILIEATQLQYNSIPSVKFTNPKPLSIHLVDDLLSFSDFSLSISDDEAAFIQTRGELDLKSEEINFSSKGNQVLELASILDPLGFPVAGKLYYDFEYKGTLKNPRLRVNWRIPELVLKTGIGDIFINEMKSNVAPNIINWQDGKVDVQPFAMQVLGNRVEIGGNIVVNQRKFEDSSLSAFIKSENLDLNGFNELLKASLNDRFAEYFSSQQHSPIRGNLRVNIDVMGTITEPSFDVNTHTIDGHLIHIGDFTYPIAIDRLRTSMTYSKGMLSVNGLDMSGRSGEGKYKTAGKATFSLHDSAANGYKIRQFTIKSFEWGLSFEEIVIDDFLHLLIQPLTPIEGVVSGTTQITRTGLTSNRIISNTIIESLNLNILNYSITNTASLVISFDKNHITAALPLKVANDIDWSELTALISVEANGTLDDPRLTINWDGAFQSKYSMASVRTQSKFLTATSPLQFTGDMTYLNELISLNTQLTNNRDKLILKGEVPINLSFTDVDMSERFLDSAVSLQFVGSELPLTFMSGAHSIFAESSGVFDVNVAVDGTTRNPYLKGDIFIESPKLQLKNMQQSLENVSIHVAASRDLIALEKFQFDVEDGTCSLEQCELQLDGITPKAFLIKGLTFEQYSLGSILSEALPQEFFDDVNGYVTATLKQLRIPFESFFYFDDLENPQNMPLPRAKNKITFDRISQKATAEISIDELAIGFASSISGLDKEFKFTNLTPIPITLESGTFIVKEMKLIDAIETNSTDVAEPMSPTTTVSCFGRWNMQGEMFGNLKLDNFNMDLVQQTFSDDIREKYNLSGILSAELNVKGEYAAPEVTIKFAGRQMRINETDIDEFFGVMQYIDSKKRWTIAESNPARIKIGDNRLSCYGYIPFLLSFSTMEAQPHPSILAEQMEMTVNVALEQLSKLRDIAGYIQSADGQITINATLTGTPDAYQLKGKGSVNQLDISLTDSPIAFENVDASFDFTHEGIQIENVNGVLNDGNFSIDGIITSDWLNFRTIDINAQLENCSFIEPGTYQIVLSADNLHLYGNVDNPILDGDIRILSGFYEQNWNWIDVLESFAAPTVSDTDIISDAPILRNLNLDLGIAVLDSFHLLSSTGGTTNIEIICNGQVNGTIQRPIFSGTVTIPKGVISIYTQIFEINESVTSTVINQSDKSFNPELNIHMKLPNTIRNVLQSDGSTADYDFYASVTGTLENGNPDQAVLSLRAEPINSSTTEELTEADLLALLLPGNTFSQSLVGITFTITSGFNANERHITAEIPLTLLGRNIPITVEGNEKKGEFGVDIQLLQGQF